MIKKTNITVGPPLTKRSGSAHGISDCVKRLPGQSRQNKTGCLTKNYSFYFSAKIYVVSTQLNRALDKLYFQKSTVLVHFVKKE